MLKSFLIIISFPILLFSSQQIILVVADNFNSSKAKMECFEGSKKLFDSIDVNIGRNGLGWGLGEINIAHKKSEIEKFEGDKKAPAGVFKLSSIFGYKKYTNFKMPYLFTSKNLICIDDIDSKNYNKLVYMTNLKPKSFEYMKRDDNQYELGIVVEHNENAIKRRGSCIFIHVQKEKNHPTVGCTSMSLKNIKKITSWLDKNKNPILIQIPKSYTKEVLKIYPQLKKSELLNN